MSSPVYFLRERATVKSIYRGITTLNVHGYPILDESNRVVGLIGREYLMVLL
jgi:hypothetical protein